MLYPKPVYKYANTLEYDEEDIYTIWMAFVEGMTAIWGAALKDEYGSAKSVWDNCRSFDERAPFERQEEDGVNLNIPLGLRQQLKLRRDGAFLDKTLSELKEKRIFCVRNGHPYYPEALSHIYDPPLALFVRGNVNLNQERMICVVGTRNCTKYGRDISFKLAKSLSIAGVTIVSGLALGVDCCANSGALDGPTPTFAVLGTGTDVIYPKENEELYGRIIKSGGSIISEFIPGTTSARWRFPMRNRVMSGMCGSVVVVQAPMRSGTIHTVEAAGNQGRDVFAIPGDVTLSQSELPNKLISDGCRCVTSAWDIIEEYNWGTRPVKDFVKQRASKPEAVKEPVVSEVIISDNSVESREAIYEEYIKNIDDILDGFDNKDDIKRIILCIGWRELSQNDITETVELPVSKVNSHLTMLELRSIIEQVQSGDYRLCLKPEQEE